MLAHDDEPWCAYAAESPQRNGFAREHLARPVAVEASDLQSTKAAAPVPHLVQLDIVQRLDAVDDLPPVARPYAFDDAWRRQFIGGFRQVAHRLGSPDEQNKILLRCTAEEVALHIAIDLAKGDTEEGLDPPAPYLELPDHGDRDVDFEWMREVLFEDHDVLMLYNPALDGIENDLDSNPLLHPRDWFEPFR